MGRGWYIKRTVQTRPRRPRALERDDSDPPIWAVESRGPDGLCVDQATQDSKGFRQPERFAPRPRAIRGIAPQFRRPQQRLDRIQWTEPLQRVPRPATLPQGLT